MDLELQHLSSKVQSLENERGLRERLKKERECLHSEVDNALSLKFTEKELPVINSLCENGENKSLTEEEITITKELLEAIANGKHFGDSEFQSKIESYNRSERSDTKNLLRAWMILYYDQE